MSGCIYLYGYRILDTHYQDVTPTSDQPRIRGLARLINDSPKQPVAVVFAHGGGPDQAPGYSNPLRTALARQLSLSMEPQCIPPQPLPNEPDDDPADHRARRGKQSSQRASDESALFSMCEYAIDVDRSLRFYELYWHPVWRRIWSANLKFDDDNPLGGLWLNHFAKKALLNDRFAEEVLYGGTFRNELLRPVRFLLCAISDDGYANDLLGNRDGLPRCDFKKQALQTRPQKRIVAVGMSLGSVMLIDGIARARGDAKTAADAVMAQMEALFMLSNQVPVSRLADIRALPSADAPEPVVSREFVDLLHQRCARREPLSSRASVPKCSPLEIVAVTDPNDVAGYFIWQAQIPPDAEWPYATWTNALVHNARWAVPGLVANPVHAHEDHAENRDVIYIIACGVPAQC